MFVFQIFICSCIQIYICEVYKQQWGLFVVGSLWHQLLNLYSLYLFLYLNYICISTFCIFVFVFVLKFYFIYEQQWGLFVVGSLWRQRLNLCYLYLYFLKIILVFQLFVFVFVLKCYLWTTVRPICSWQPVAPASEFVQIVRNAPGHVSSLLCVNMICYNCINFICISNLLYL